MMSIIGWVALIYVFIGCGLTVTLYAILSYYDDFEYFTEDIYDNFKKIGINVSYEFANSFTTVTLIFNWVLVILVVTYLIIQDKKESEA
jgi:hypothetical protein